MTSILKKVRISKQSDTLSRQGPQSYLSDAAKSRSMSPDVRRPFPKSQMNNRSHYGGSMYGGGGDDMRSQHAQSDKSLMDKGLGYKFSLKDLTKYSQRLNIKDLNNDRWGRSALGRDLNKRDEDDGPWKKLKKDIRNAQNQDWIKSSIYWMFKEQGRYKNENPDIYSESELRYYIAILNKLRKEKYKEDRTIEEKKSFIESHHKKAMMTLKILMRQLNLEYFYDRVELRYSDVKVKVVVKALIRSLKLYEAIDNIILIFKLLNKKEVSL